VSVAAPRNEPALGDDRAAPARRSWPTIATVVGAGFVLWGWMIGLARLSDNSLFTHLATGRLILEDGFPRSDPYSFTAAGEPWVVQSWLVSILYAQVERWSGAGAIQLVAAGMSALVAGLVWLLSAPARALVGRIAICGLVLGVGGVAWSQRPLLFGLAFLGMVLLAAEGRIPAWTVLPVMWLWVNSHGSFPLGLVALATLLVGRRLDGEDANTEQRVLGWAAAGTVLGMVGPLGLRALAFPFELLGRQETLSNIVEWQSPDFSSNWTRLFLVQVVVAVVLLVRRPSYRTAVPLVVFVAAALLGSRNIAVASIVLVPGMARGWTGLGGLTGSERGRVAKVGLVVAAVLMVFTAAVRLGQPTWDLRTYPVDATAWLDQRGALTPDSRIIGRERVGNYFELVFGTDQPVFFDDRVDMYPPEVVEDVLVLDRGRPEWAAVLERWEADAVVWERRGALAQLLAAHPGWRTAYVDDDWVVACRVELEWCAATGSVDSTG
jgi:hypothetical protein